MEENKEIKGIGVPDGDGGSIERENRRDTITKERDDEAMLENDLNDENEDDDDDWDGGELENEDEDDRDNESVDGAMNNPGVRVSSGGNFLSFNNLGVEFFEAEQNRTLACPATSNPRDGFYFKGE